MGLAVRISIRQPSATSLFMVSQTIESKQRKLNELESEIVSLGRRGATEDAIERYESIENPNIRILNAAIDACARAIPTRLDLAFELLDQGIKTKGLTPNVFTFGAIMSACNRARRADRAVKLLRTMQVRLSGMKHRYIILLLNYLISQLESPERVWRQTECYRILVGNFSPGTN